VAGRKRSLEQWRSLLWMQSLRVDMVGRKHLSSLAYSSIPISSQSVFRILRKNKFRETKPTRKPGLTKDLFAKRYEHWTLEDWKSDIQDLRADMNVLRDILLIKSIGLQSVMRGSSALERPTGFTRMHGRSSNVPLLDCQPSTLRILSLWLAFRKLLI